MIAPAHGGSENHKIKGVSRTERSSVKKMEIFIANMVPNSWCIYYSAMPSIYTGMNRHGYREDASRGAQREERTA